MARVKLTLESGEVVLADEVILRARPVDYLNIVGQKIATAFRRNEPYAVEVLTLRERADLAFSESGSVKVRFYDGSA